MLLVSLCIGSNGTLTAQAERPSSVATTFSTWAVHTVFQNGVPLSAKDVTTGYVTCRTATAVTSRPMSDASAVISGV